jgi:hypothetical protein
LDGAVLRFSGFELDQAAQIEHAIGGKWNAGQKPMAHVTQG